MKYSILFFFAFLFSLPVFSQSAYDDALELASIYRKHGNSFKPLTRTDAPDETIIDLGRFLDILYRHYDTIWGPTKTPTANNLISFYRENNFFQNYELPAGVNDAASAMALKMAAENRFLTKTEGGGVPSSGLNVATIADGIAKFLVKRTKEELTVAFFEDLRQALAKNQQLEVLFPASRMLLLGIGDQIYNFNAYLGSMREAFQADFKRLPFSLETLLTQSNAVLLKDSIPVYYVTDLFKTTRLLLERNSINGIIAYLGRDANFQQQQSPIEKENFIKVKSVLRLLYIVSESVQAYSDDRPFIQAGLFKNLLKDQIGVDFYLGLVAEQAKNVTVGSFNLGEALNAQNANRFLSVTGSFIELGERLHAIKTGIQTGEFQKNDSLLYFQYFDYVQVALDLIKTTKNFSEVVFPQEKGFLKELDNVNFVLGRISSISLDVRRKHYSNAIVHAGLLANELIRPENDFSCPLLRFGAFMAAISESRNSDDVAAVMESFALPRGSSYIKKHYPFNLSIGSYVGFNAALEILNGLDSKDKTGLNAGLGAPIGVAFSWGLESYNGNSPGSFSLYLNVVDIGAFTAYRFTNNDAVNDLPALKFDNIFAPGAALVYGLPKFPGSISLFSQRGPSLRKVTGDGYEIDETNAWRIGLSFAVDIPLFNLYTQGKKSGCGYSQED